MYDEEKEQKEVAGGNKQEERQGDGERINEKVEKTEKTEKT